MEKCLLCGKDNMKRIGFHLRKMHNLSVAEYRERFSGKEQAVPKPNLIKKHGFVHLLKRLNFLAPNKNEA